MARPRVRRKTRNPSSKTSRRQRNPYNISFAGVHPLVQKSWDKTKTLRQNYEAMGLVASVNGVTGGSIVDAKLRTAERARIEDLKNNVEWRVIDRTAQTASSGTENQAKKDEEEPFPGLGPIEAPVETDARTKAIGFKVDRRSTAHVHAASSQNSAASKPVSDVVAAMEEQSRNVVQVERKASEQERMVLTELVAKHGEDYGAMSRDLRLNKYQFSAGQLKRKIKTLLK